MFQNFFQGNLQHAGASFPNPLSVQLTTGGTSKLLLGTTDLHTNAATARTIVTWIKVTDFSGYNIFWSDQITRGLGNGIATTTGKVFWDMYDGGTGELGISSDGAISAGVWQMVTTSYDASSTPGGIKMWIGNTLQTTTTTANVAFVLSTTSTDKVAIGSISTISSPFWVSGGRLNMMASYSRAFVQADVDAIYGGGHPVDLSTLGSYSNIEAWWRMGNHPSDTTNTIVNAANPGTYDLTASSIAIVSDHP